MATKDLPRTLLRVIRAYGIASEALGQCGDYDPTGNTVDDRFAQKLERRAERNRLVLVRCIQTYVEV
jgi:hypothetical protein